MKTLSLFILLSCAIYGQAKFSINPGIKIGVVFGEKVEFNFGYELSFVIYNLGSNNDNAIGIVFDYDTVGEVKRLHVGVEYIYRVIGIDIGPTFAWKESKMHNGFSIIPFGGLGFYPYINFTNTEGINDQFEIGSYLKIPIPFSGEGLKIGG